MGFQLKSELISASITGIFRVFLMLIGLFVLFRFVGQLMIAKRNLKEQSRDEENRKAFQKEKFQKQKMKGTTKISHSETAEDVDFEEVN